MNDIYRELLLGAGTNSRKEVWVPGTPRSFSSPVRVDIDPDSMPDVLWDLNKRPLPFDNAEFDEIHAYEVLEHIGTQGDWRGFFEEFTEYHRILKPGGLFCAHVPWWKSVWAWGDPGHTRVILPETISFLLQKHYEQVGQTCSTDYRAVYSADWELALREHKLQDGQPETEGHYLFALRKI